MTTTPTNESMFDNLTLNRDRIVEANLGLVYTVANRLSSRRDRDDAIATGMMALVKAVDTFDPSKGYRFSTYATSCITNEILTARRTETNARKRVEKVLVITPRSSLRIDESPEQINMRAVIHSANLDERQQQVLECRYGISRKRLTLAQTAKELGISTARVQQIEVEILELLRKIVEK